MSVLAPADLPDWPAAMPEALAAAYVGLSATTLRRLTASGGAPAPIHVSPGRIAWRRADLDRWLDERAGIAPASAAKSLWDG